MKVSRRKAIEKALIATTGATLFSDLPKSAQSSERKALKHTYLLKREIPVSKTRCKSTTDRKHRMPGGHGDFGAGYSF